MEGDRCYYISDKKPRRDTLRWESHTEKVEEQLLKLVLHWPHLEEVGDNSTWKTDIKSTMEDREQ